MKLWLTKLLVAAGGSAAALSLTTGVALAQPDLTPFINTTCSYQQIVAALNAQDPQLAQELSGRPQVQTMLQQFLAMPTDRRRASAVAAGRDRSERVHRADRQHVPELLIRTGGSGQHRRGVGEREPQVVCDALVEQRAVVRR